MSIEQKVPYPTEDKKAEKSQAEIQKIMAARRSLFSDHDIPLEIESGVQDEAQVQNEAQVQADVDVNVEVGVGNQVDEGKHANPEDLIKGEEVYTRETFKDHPIIQERIQKQIKEDPSCELELIKKWDKLVGNIPVEACEEKNIATEDKKGLSSPKHLHQHVSKITESALAEILKNEALLLGEIDFDHFHGFGVCNQTFYMDSSIANSPLPPDRFKIALADPKIKENFQFPPKFSDVIVQKWWELLYDKHQKAAEEYNIKLTEAVNQELVRCFTVFLVEINQLEGGLTLPQLTPNSLRDAKSLPVTLGRILSLVKNPALTGKKERQDQLNLIPKLSLSSTGAIRALSDQERTLHPCRFVTPKMHCESTQFSMSTGYEAPKLPESEGDLPKDSYRNISVIYEGVYEQMKDEKVAYEKTKRAFWRHVAHQKKGMPLAFYEGEGGAVDLIEKANLKNIKCKVYLYECLAAISTNSGLIFKEDAKTVLTHWKNFIQAVVNIHKTNVKTRAANKLSPGKIQLKALEKLRELDVLPPAALLEKVFALTVSCIKQNKMEVIDQAFYRLNTIFWRIKQSNIKLVDSLKRKYEESEANYQSRIAAAQTDLACVYEGMRFSLEKDENNEFNPEDPKKSSFFDYLKMLERITEHGFGFQEIRHHNHHVTPYGQEKFQQRVKLLLHQYYVDGEEAKREALKQLNMYLCDRKIVGSTENRDQSEINNADSKTLKAVNNAAQVFLKGWYENQPFEPIAKYGNGDGDGTVQYKNDLWDLIHDEFNKKFKHCNTEISPVVQEFLIRCFDVFHLKPEEITDVATTLSKIEKRILDLKKKYSEFPLREILGLFYKASYGKTHTVKTLEPMLENLRQQVEAWGNNLSEKNAAESNYWSRKEEKEKDALDKANTKIKPHNCIVDFIEALDPKQENKKNKREPSVSQKARAELNGVLNFYKNRNEKEDKKESSEQKVVPKEVAVFEAGFLEKKRIHYKEGLLPEEVVEELKRCFPDPSQQEVTRSILAHYYEDNSQNNIALCIKVLHQLKDLGILYQDPFRLQEFLYQWKEYCILCTTKHSLEEFSTLLELVLQTGNPNPLESMIFRENIEKTNILPKSISLYRHVQPWLKENTKRIPDKISYPTMVEILLAVPDQEFQAKQDRKHKEQKEQHVSTFSDAEDQVFDQLRILLKDIDSPQKITPAFIQKVEEIKQGLPKSSNYTKYLDNWLSLLCQLQQTILMENKSTHSENLVIKSEAVNESISLKAPKEQPSKVKEFFQGVKNWFRKTPTENSPKTIPISEAIPETKKTTMLLSQKRLKETVERAGIQDEPSLVQHCVQQLNVCIAEQEKSRSDYSRRLNKYYERIYKIVENVTLPELKVNKEEKENKNIQSKEQIHKRKIGFRDDWLNFMRRAVQEKSAENGGTFEENLDNQLACFEEINEHEIDTRALRRLLYHCSEMQAEPKKPSELMEFLHCVKEKKLDKTLKKSLYQMLARVIGQKNSEKQEILTLDDFKIFIQTPELLEQIETFYRYPPYPTLSSLIEKHQAGELKDFTETYKENTEPFDRDKKKNGFTLQEFIDQAKKFKPQNLEHLSDNNLKIFYAKIHDYRGLTLHEKMEALPDILSGVKKDKRAIIKLAAILAEILYASTGLELNRTQYLVLLNNLLTGGHITHQVGTGEGKSRILMLLCAAKCLLGKSVDFISNMPKLVERDFYKFQDFFDACNIPTQLVNVNTLSSDFFCKDRVGINFSTPVNLGLFLRKVGTRKNERYPWNKNKVLILDEADLLDFDLEGHSVRFSEPVDQRLKDIGWVYPIAVNFVRQVGFVEKYQRDYVAVLVEFKEELKKFAQHYEKRAAQVDEINDDDIEKWLRAAIRANRLKQDSELTNKLDEKANFEVEKDRLHATEGGMRVVSRAIVKQNNILYSQSHYSDAIQQCLGAKLNLAREEQRAEERERAAKGEQEESSSRTPSEAYTKTPFEDKAESRVVSASTASLLLADYLEDFVAGGTNPDAQIIQMTGTAGSKLERESLQDKIPGMQFVDVPPNQPSKRNISSTYITGDLERQRKVLLEKTKQAIDSHRPVLLVCETDAERKALIEFFQHAEGIDPNAVQTVYDGMKDTEYKQCIKHAATAGKITIATNLFGRGTDIEVDKAVSDAGGLYVLATYLPKTRDQMQIFGRTARLDSEGQARAVLRKEQILQLSKIYRDDDQVYGDVDHYLEVLKTKWEEEDTRLRIVLEFKNRYCHQLQRHFFQNVKQKMGLEGWAGFLEDQGNSWNGIWGQLSGDIKELGKKMEPQRKEKLLSNISGMLKNFIEERYAAYQKKFGLSQNTVLPDLLNLSTALTNLRDKLGKSELPEYILKSEPKWESAHTGKHVRYHQLFAERRGLWRKFRKDKRWESFKDFLEPDRLLWRAETDNRILHIKMKEKPSFANTSAWWSSLSGSARGGYVLLGIVAAAVLIGVVYLGTGAFFLSAKGAALSITNIFALEIAHIVGAFTVGSMLAVVSFASWAVNRRTYVPLEEEPKKPKETLEKVEKPLYQDERFKKETQSSNVGTQLENNSALVSAGSFKIKREIEENHSDSREFSQAAGVEVIK